jgi:hypothetical protein
LIIDQGKQTIGGALTWAHTKPNSKGVRMTRKIKMLGMALVAVLALTAVAASAASAASYTASTYPTTATGESALGNDVFTTEAGKVECKSHFESTLKASSTDITITGKYTECRAFGFLNAVVSHCTYTLTEASAISVDTYNASAIHIIGSPCTISAGTCKVSVPLQGPLGSLEITDDTAAGDVTFKANVTGIKYTVTEDGFACPFGGTGEKTGATYTEVNPITLDAVSPSTATIDVG